MRKFFLLLILPLVLGACTSKPETAAPADPVAVEPAAPPPAVAVDTAEEDFDPVSISREVFQATKAEIQGLVENLNTIIRGRDFAGWVSCLGDSYIKERSSRAFLDQASNQPRLHNQKKLVDFEDYFLRVVVSSRNNDRVDDIEFVSPRQVKAYTINARGERLRLYELENTGGGWKIIN